MIKARFDYNSKTYKEYEAYMNEYAPKVYEAQMLIDSIRNSKEWKRASNYFKVLYKRGIILENPCKANGYKITPTKENYYSISDLKDILTAEQISLIENMGGTKNV